MAWSWLRSKQFTFVYPAHLNECETACQPKAIVIYLNISVEKCVQLILNEEHWSHQLWRSLFKCIKKIFTHFGYWISMRFKPIDIYRIYKYRRNVQCQIYMVRCTWNAWHIPLYENGFLSLFFSFYATIRFVNWLLLHSLSVKIA